MNSHSLVDCVEDYRRRMALGETPRPEEYRTRAGDSYDEFVRTVSDGVPVGDPPEEGSFPREFGEYSLTGVLGRGAMGVVYDALDRRLDRRVAVKVLRSDLPTGSPSLERFKREARACSRVRHPNVVEIYEAGDIGGRPFYAMARHEGRSLAALAAEGEFSDPGALARGLAGVADALDAFHRAGIVHRDVKPSNILVDPDGRMILTDFGLARTAVDNSLTQTGEALGTPRYMSPEQALGTRDEIDGRTDLYGLGATMYEVLSGGKLFDADDTRGMLRQILSERPLPLVERVPDVGSDCSAVVMKALEKRSGDRYQTAAVMRDDLIALAEGRSVVGRPVSPLRHWLRRWRTPGIAGAALLAAIAAFFILQGNRPAVLEILSHPAAEVVLDGEVLGMTPVKREVEAGPHVVVMRLAGFKEHRHPLNLEAGERRTLERVLHAEDPEDPVALAELAQTFEIPAAPVARGSKAVVGPTSFHLVKVGNLRPEDLEALRLEIPKDMQSSGDIRIRRGDQVLYSETLESAEALAAVEVPDEVKKALKSGDQVTWGFYCPDGRTMEAKIDIVVPDDVRRQVKVLARRLDKQDPRVLGHMKSRLYLANGLNYAALEEARKLMNSGEVSPHAWAVMCKALQAMNLGDTPECKELAAKLRQVANVPADGILRPRQRAQPERK